MRAENTFIIKPETPEQENALEAFIKALKINFEIIKEDIAEPYNPEFVEKVKRSEKQLKEGQGSAIKTADLWK